MRFALLLLTCGVIFGEISIPPVVSIQPSQILDLNTILSEEYRSSSVVQAIAANRDSFAVLITPFQNQNSQQLVIFFSNDGKVKHIVKIDTPVETGWLSLDDTGKAYVLKSRRAGILNTSILAIDKTGVTEYAQFSELVMTVVVSKQGEAFGWFRDGSIRAARANGRIDRARFSIPYYFHPRLVAINSHEIMAIKPSIPTIEILNVSEGKSILLDPDSPEIRKGRQKYSQSSPETGLIVNSATANDLGQIFLNISGHPVAEGGVVVVIDKSGKVLQRLRCLNPKVERPVATELEKLFHPVFITVTSKNLLYLDNRGIVGIYPLPGALKITNSHN